MPTQEPFSQAQPFTPLEPGATLGAAAPASPLREEEVGAAVAWLKSKGFGLIRFPVRTGPQAYLAGGDAQRAAELTGQMADPKVGGVICLRGGYGCLRTAPLLDFTALAATAKPLIGFSDCTVLLAGLLSAGRASIHGPALVSLASQSQAGRERLLSILAGRWSQVEPLAGRPAAGVGRGEGYLVGGNLTVLAHLVGTPWQPPTRGGIVFIEDRGEKLYRLDRALTHLLAAGFFEGCAGVAAGRLDDVETEEAAGLLAERLGGLGVPVLAGLPFGHGPENMALLVGGRAVIDLEAGWLAPTT